ncbi:MAG: hypothetical protein Q9201_007585 [Fulgogasparrea decipioides]
MQVGCRGPSFLRSQISLLPFLAPSIQATSPVVAFYTLRTYVSASNPVKCKRTTNSHACIRHASSAAAPEQQSPEGDGARSNPESLFKLSRRFSEDLRKRHTTLLDRMRNLQKYQQAPRSKEDRDQEIDALLGGPSHSTTTGSNRPDSRMTLGDIHGGSSADYVERKRAEQQRKDFAEALAQRGSRQGRIFRGMVMPQAQNAPAEQSALHIEEPTRAVATIKSRPSLGRTVEVVPERGLDLGRALRSLEINCAVNNVRGDALKQKFHERPGLKRKRLKSVRWRRNFKQGFKAVVAKVKAMRRKGW